MRRVVITGMALLLCGAIAAPGDTSPIVFIFGRVDAKQNLAILHPIIAPDIGVQLDAGPRKLERGTVLNCRASARTHSAIVETQIGQVSELLLDCGEYKFVVKTIDFDPHAK